MKVTPSQPIWILALILLSGCGTVHSIVGGTPYQPFSTVTGGYSETALAPDVVRIVFRGNSSTTKERAQDMALLRAADLSQKSGFKYFTVLREESETRPVATDPTINAPRSEIQVQFLNDKVPGELVFDDEFLLRTMKIKYEIP